METTEVKNAFEALVAELTACTNKASYLRDAVSEAYKLIDRYPQPPDDVRSRLLTAIKDILRNALEKP